VSEEAKKKAEPSLYLQPLLVNISKNQIAELTHQIEKLEATLAGGPFVVCRECSTARRCKSLLNLMEVKS